MQIERPAAERAIKLGDKSSRIGREYAGERFDGGVADGDGDLKISIRCSGIAAARDQSGKWGVWVFSAIVIGKVGDGILFATSDGAVLRNDDTVTKLA